MIVAPAATATARNTRSPHLLSRRLEVGAGVLAGTVGVSPIRAAFTFRFSPLGEPTARGSDVVMHAPYEIASIAVTSRSLNRSGIGMYPFSSRPFWPSEVATVRNALSA